MWSLLFVFLLVICFGGMVTFQLLFAPVLFTRLDMPTARAFIRRFFPFYYLYFGVLSAIAGLAGLMLGDFINGVAMLLCAVGFIYARQVLMHKANDATDSGNKKGFAFYHMATVVINSLQILLMGYLIFRALG